MNYIEKRAALELDYGKRLCQLANSAKTAIGGWCIDYEAKRYLFASFVAFDSLRILVVMTVSYLDIGGEDSENGHLGRSDPFLPFKVLRPKGI